jgi:1-acyl-sn-glycerol-3-phosphate acyltransferase
MAMSTTALAEHVHTDIDKWDPDLTRRAVDLMRPIAKRYFRSEVRGLENIPQGGCLVVQNHSGGVLTPDWEVLVVDYYDKFGYDRPIYALAHDMLFTGATTEFLARLGVLRANHEHAAEALAAGNIVLVFPGGDEDCYRPTMSENVIGFAGRTGYVRTAIQAGVPIVPSVSVGAQENQFYLTRGTWLSHALGLSERMHKLGRTEMLPITFGFPFGLSLYLPINVPLPTKIVTLVLPPIDIAAKFGEDPDVDAVDAHVRSVMQSALTRLAHRRRFPVLG